MTKMKKITINAVLVVFILVAVGGFVALKKYVDSSPVPAPHINEVEK